MNIIQKGKIRSESRNKKRIIKQNKKGDSTTNEIKEIKGLTLNSRRRTSENSLYEKNEKKKMNLSLNKFPFVGGINNNFNKFRLNKTYIESPIISLNNISISKIKQKVKNTINISKNNENGLL